MSWKVVAAGVSGGRSVCAWSRTGKGEDEQGSGPGPAWPLLVERSEVLPDRPVALTTCGVEGVRLGPPVSLSSRPWRQPYVVPSCKRGISAWGNLQAPGVLAVCAQPSGQALAPLAHA